MERLGKACIELKKDGFGFALASTHENVAYLSGLNTPLPITYPTETPLAFPLSMVLVNVREESAVLIAVDSLRDLAARQCVLPQKEFLPPGAEVERPHKEMSYLAGIGKVLAGGAKGAHARLGIEVKSLPPLIHDWIREAFKGIEIADATPALERSRRIKTAKEVQALRNAARVNDAAQTELVSASKTHGRNELEVWTGILQAIYFAAGDVVPAFGELVTGPRTNEVHYPGGPRNRVIGRGDTGILDISVRVDGYWSDCCNTVVFGEEPSGAQTRYMLAAMECFEAALQALRPGVRCCDVAEAIEKVQERHGVRPPRFYGHQLGVVVNEHPRIIPSDTTVIEPGMVFCLEPGAYAGTSGTTGARFEKTVLVTEKGPEVLHRFQWGFTPKG